MNEPERPDRHIEATQPPRLLAGDLAEEVGAKIDAAGGSEIIQAGLSAEHGTRHELAQAWPSRTPWERGEGRLGAGERGVLLESLVCAISAAAHGAKRSVSAPMCSWSTPQLQRSTVRHELWAKRVREQSAEDPEQSTRVESMPTATTTRTN